MARQLGADRGFVAEQEEAEVVAALEGQGGAGDHHRRAGIATHRVDCDPRGAAHRRRLPLLEPEPSYASVFRISRPL